MMSLFDKEQIMKTYWKDMENTLAHKKDRETAERMIKDGEFSLQIKSVKLLTIQY